MGRKYMIEKEKYSTRVNGIIILKTELGLNGMVMGLIFKDNLLII